MASKLILSPDRMDLETVCSYGALGPRLYAVKVHGLIDLDGAKVVCPALKRAGYPLVWSDVKLLDTARTVGYRAQVLASAGVDIISVHAGDPQHEAHDPSRFPQAIDAAVKSGALIYVVTVLTSVPAGAIEERYGMARDRLVFKRAQDAVRGGAHGIVCSSRDALMLSLDPFFNCLEKVVPGTNLLGQDTLNQKQATTPQEAFKNKATKLVVGSEWAEAPAEQRMDVFEQYEAASL